MGKRSNGEGTIYAQRDNGKIKRWIGQITINGKRKSVYGKTQAEVKEKLKQIQLDIYTNSYCDSSDITVYELGKQIVDRKLDANIITESTYLRNTQTFNSCSPIFNYSVQKIDSKTIQNFYNTLTKYSNSYIGKIHLFLKQLFNEAIRQKIISENPLDGVLKPKSIKQDKVIEAFTTDEQMAIMGALEGEAYKNIFLIGFNTGMRIGEILALTPQDIDFTNKRIDINKTITKDKDGNSILGTTTKTYEGTRKIPITSVLEPILRQSIRNYKPNENNLLFTLSNGNIIANSTINSRLKRICKNLNIKQVPYTINRGTKTIHSSTSSVNTHMLRHTYATRCIESGMPPKVLQKLLGHKDVSVTLNTYTSVFNKFEESSLDSYLKYMEELKNN